MKILDEKTLLVGDGDHPISPVYYRCPEEILCTLTREEVLRYFFAVCFTEAPPHQINLFLNIDRRIYQLRPYGLVFYKDRCMELGVSPVLYFNNKSGNMDKVFTALCYLIRDHPIEASQILPLVSFFGKYLKIIWNGWQRTDEMNFTWERESGASHRKTDVLLLRNLIFTLDSAQLRKSANSNLNIQV